MIQLLTTVLLLLHQVAGQYTNPILWEDTPDIDIIRVDDTFYYSASSFHLSPGAPILRSYDLVNWEYAGHSVPVLDWTPDYDLTDGNRAYVQGIWASFFNYRKSTETFYWGGCVRDDGRTAIYTAPSVEGPWEQLTALDSCYYDAGLLIDEEDDTLYVAYGETEISVAELSSDGTSEVRNELVFTADFTLEGARFYKKDGSYYIFLTRPADGQFILRSTDGPFGPYEIQPLLDAIDGPIVGGGTPHQGGLVDTQNGDWYYLSFIDAYPGGRVPALAPITWEDGWPVLALVDGAWGESYPNPDLPAPPNTVKPPTGSYDFGDSSLPHEWEWNHNPDNTKWSLDNGLHLSTATVTDDLYAARNTLTHRTRGPVSTATIVLDYSSMADGDRSGLSLFRDSSAWVGIARDSGACTVNVVNDITMTDTWETATTGTTVESAEVPETGTIWLRATADIQPEPAGVGTFAYSLDGDTFTPIGGDFTFKTEWQFFLGYRFGIFNYATTEIGGSVTVSNFTLTQP